MSRMVKIDPYKNEQRWTSWKETYVGKPPEKVRKEDWALLVEFLKDMELGLNTPKGKKGKRETGTLLNLASHNKLFLQNFKKPLTKLTKVDLHNLEKLVNEGKIKKRNGKPFTAFGNYIKDFKVFWNWLLRTKRVEENIIEDITSKVDKPSWVYLTEKEVRKFFNDLSLEYKTICFFLYDSGMRVTEAINIQVKDFSKGFGQVTISDETAKTFGRTINLKLCTDLVREYINDNSLKQDDYLITKKPFAINKYLKYHAGRIFGKDKVSHPKSKGKYGDFTMYDIRHNASCFWFNKYPTHKGLMYRMGWRKADKIEYYSDFLGVSDELTDADMVLGEDKNKLFALEKELEILKKVVEGLVGNISDGGYEIITDPNSKIDIARMKRDVAKLEKMQ